MIGWRQANLTNGIMILLDKRTVAIALVGALALAGCGKPQRETQPATIDSPAAAPSDAQQMPTPAEPGAPVIGTNEALTGAAAFQRDSLASPFAQAELALKESYNRALIAFQIGDYARAVSELDDLAATPDLTPAQRQAVKELNAKALKLAPDLAPNRAVTAGGISKPEPPPEFPVTVPGTVESPKNVPESPFSTADPAVKDSFARAKAAYDIGDYEKALAELQDLATNSQLNFQQKYAVQALLDKTPRK
jgi:tetratricopeptide (TPR) repeat protein